MHCRSIAPLAVFLDLKFLALLLLVDSGRVVTPFALRTCESDYVCHVEKIPFVKLNVKAKNILAQAFSFSECKPYFLFLGLRLILNPYVVLI